nr:PREDICTED: U6 snRNA-associated Sm-like protein LSm1 [Struthio camelus australis]
MLQLLAQGTGVSAAAWRWLCRLLKLKCSSRVSVGEKSGSFHGLVQRICQEAVEVLISDHAISAVGVLPGSDEMFSLARNKVKDGCFLFLLIAAANLVLHQTVERIHVGKKYGDIPRGIFVVRGENVVLLGEIDLEKESDTPLQQVSIEEILEEQRVEQQAKQESEKLKVQALKERGLSVPRADTLDEY